MQCPECKKARLKKLRIFVQGTRVRRECRCPKCGARPVTIEISEREYLQELADRDQTIRNQDSQIEGYGFKLQEMQEHAKALFSFLLPTPEPVQRSRSPKKGLSAKKNRKRTRK